MPTAHSLLLNFEELLIKEFKGYLEKKGVSKVTSKNYISDIRNFLSRVALLDTVEVVSAGLNKYIVESSKIYSPATLKRKLSSLRIFCNWAFEKGYLKENLLVQWVGGPENSVYQKSQPVSVSEKPASTPLRNTDIPTLRYSDTPSFPTFRPSDPLKERAKTTFAAVSGFGSVFVILFIVKSLFGNSLLGLTNAPQTRPVPVSSSFGNLLALTTVLGTSTQEAVRHGTEVLPAESKEVSIYNPNVTSSSIVQVVPENSIESALFVDQKASGNYFTVEVDRPIPYDVAFNWSIIEP